MIGPSSHRILKSSGLASHTVLRLKVVRCGRGKRVADGLPILPRSEISTCCNLSLYYRYKVVMEAIYYFPQTTMLITRFAYQGWNMKSVQLFAVSLKAVGSP